MNGRRAALERVIRAANPVDTAGLARSAGDPAAQAMLARILASDPRAGRRCRHARRRLVAAVALAALVVPVAAVAVAGVDPRGVLLRILTDDEKPAPPPAHARLERVAEDSGVVLAAEPRRIITLRAPTVWREARWTDWVAYDVWGAPTRDGGYCVTSTTEASAPMATVPALFDCWNAPRRGLMPSFAGLIYEDGRGAHSPGFWLSVVAPPSVDVLELRFENGAVERLRSADATPSARFYATLVGPDKLRVGHRVETLVGRTAGGAVVARYEWDCRRDLCSLDEVKRGDNG